MTTISSPASGDDRRGSWPPILSAGQAAELLHLASAREVLKLARQGVFPSSKAGKRRLFLLDELIEALRRRQEPGDHQLGTGN